MPSLNFFTEFFLTAFYVAIILFFSAGFAKRKSKTDKIYKFYFPGLLYKFLFGLLFGAVYCFYYRGGDTLAYYTEGLKFINLLIQNPAGYFYFLFEKDVSKSIGLFNQETGYPQIELYLTASTLTVVKIVHVISLLTLKNFFASTVLFAWFSFLGSWQLYKLLSAKYPKLYKELALSILFIPSVVFWNSGILKDTICFTSLCWLIVGVEKVFISPRKQVIYIPVIFISLFLIYTIKSYILYALLPGGLFWVIGENLSMLKGTAWYRLVQLLLFVNIFFMGYFVKEFYKNHPHDERIIQTDSLMRMNSLEAWYKHRDFKKISKEKIELEITKPEPEIMIALAPASVLLVLTKPFFWEPRNVFMFFEGIETWLLFFFFIWVVLKIAWFRIGKTCWIIMNDPFLIMVILFSFIFLSLIGLIIHNYGAMVRLKTPVIPFMLVALFVINHRLNNPVPKEIIPKPVL